MRRERLITEAVACVHQVRDLLECAWPAVLTAAAHPFDSMTWCAALAVTVGRANGDPGRLRRLGAARFEAAVRREIPRWGGQKPTLWIIRAVFAALADPVGVSAQRPGALERVGLVLDDWRHTRRRLTDTETWMVDVLEELGLTELVTSIPGICAVGAAAILAESGDPNRFATGRALVKHAGLAPREHNSGKATGRSRLTGQGRPQLRLAAWRAAWAVVHHNPVFATRFAHLTRREHNRLAVGQAYAAIAAAVLRQLHAVITRHQAWDPLIASGHADVDMEA